MSTTENYETPKTDFFEKVANPNFSLLKFKKELDKYKTKPKLVSFAKKVFNRFNSKQAIELLDLILDPTTDLLEHERIFITLDKTIKDFNSYNLNNADKRIVTALRFALIRLEEICLLSNP